MLLNELFESKEPKALTPLEMQQLSEPNPRNIGDRFIVYETAFDNVNGLGAVPNNQEIVYRGFAALIQPTEFMKLAANADRTEDANRIFLLMKKGVPIASPFLKIECNFKEYRKGEPLKVKVVGHEGRARAHACILAQYNMAIPIQFFFTGDIRARDLDSKFFKDLKDQGIECEDTNYVHKPAYGGIFWNGKTL